MEKLNEFLVNHFNVQVSERFTKKACYYSNMDHIEYLSIDSITVSDRVDGFLTIIWDRSYEHIVGFKLKGFKAVFEKIIPLKHLKGDNFNPLIQVLECVFTEVGDEIFSGESGNFGRIDAYKDVQKFIIEERVDLDESLLHLQDQAA